ncbi:MAG TPA: (2Fe-2S)-binding protein [Tepidisphaeraceae bacterium]|jgi:aerobic-type carbon monoxide dehydrogenase small subunit (CoxS/CutS family)
MASGKPDKPTRGVSRRAFFKGAGATAVGAAILDNPLAKAAEAEARAAEPPVFGPGLVGVTLNINGSDVPLRIDPSATLVEVIRNHLNLTGTKVGCDRGACSACTVWLDGEVAASCMTLALDARGRKITTIEGLSAGDQLHPVQEAFIKHDALQCGFCTPGMVMSCAALVERKPGCNLEDVKHAISGHLCRCGTYQNIFNATLSVSGAKAGK